MSVLVPDHEIFNHLYIAMVHSAISTTVDSRYSYVMSRHMNNHTDKHGETDLTLPEAGRQLLMTAYDKLELSPADLFKCIDIARTIANLDQSKQIRVEHLAEAIQYKSYKP